MVLSTSATAEQVFARIASTVQRTCERGLYRLSFGAMSTPCRVTFHGVPVSTAAAFQREVVSWVAAFEAKYSHFLPDSLIGRINAAAGLHWIELDEDADRLFALCDSAVFFTRGAFDPTALPLIRLWRGKDRPPILPDEASVEAAKELVGWRKVQRRSGGIFLPAEGMCLDLGGIGKEYAVDCVHAMAGRFGIANVLIDFGQDIRASGRSIEKSYWAVGLEDARNPGKCWTGLAVTNGAVATSGDYLRNFHVDGRRYGHIVDPRTGYPVDNGCRAVSVIAPSCTAAGMLSTSACILGPREGVRLVESNLGVEAALTTDTDRVYTRRFYEHIIPS